MTGPTQRQLLVLRTISAHQVSKGFAITIRELSIALKCSSTNGVVDHLKALERKGLVSREKQRARTLQLTTAGRREIEHG